MTSPDLPNMMSPISLASFVYLRSVTLCLFLLFLHSCAQFRRLIISLAVRWVGEYSKVDSLSFKFIKTGAPAS